jgi:hypothetical protein
VGKETSSEHQESAFCLENMGASEHAVQNIKKANQLKTAQR